MRRFFTTLALSILPLTGCAVGDTSPYEGYETQDTAGDLATVVVPKGGISIPLPPPSFYPNEEVDVDVDGEVIGDRGLLYGAVVMARDLVSGDEVECVLRPGNSTFHCTELGIDTFDNCVELWVVFSDGRKGEPREYHAVGHTGGTYPNNEAYIETYLGCE